MRTSRGTMPLWIAALVFVATLVGGRTASAQSQADTMEVAQATAGVVGDLVLPRLGAGKPPLLGEPTQAFDRWVTLRLQQAHRLEMMPTQADTAQWVVTRGFTVRGDTAAVLVEVGTTEEPSPIGTCVTTYRYLFVRAPAGWRFVRPEHVSDTVRGEVRG